MGAHRGTSRQENQPASRSGRGGGSGRRQCREGSGRPRASRHHAALPIIAALSVHIGRLGRKPCSPSASHTSRNCSRSNEFAATPPPRHRPFAPTSAAARRALLSSTSTTACWNDAATSAVLSSGFRAHVPHDRGLEPAEREVEALVRHGPRERDRVRIAAHREPVDRRASRVAETEERRDLVERLPGSVVDRLAEQPVLPVVEHLDEHRVTTRHEQDDHWQLQVGLLHPPRRGAPRGGSRRRTARRTPTRAPSRRSRRRAVTRRAPATVAPTASMRSSSTPASTIACAITGVSISTCARQAISGTTPPNRAWRSTWLDTTDESTLVPPIDDRGRGLVAAGLDAEDARAGVDRDRPHGAALIATPRRRPPWCRGSRPRSPVAERDTRADRCRAPT